MGCGLEDGTGKLLGTGVASALDGGSLSAVLNEGGFGFDPILDGAGPGVLLKKPAMLCCLAPDFCVEPPVFLGAVRGVAISLPSMPRAILWRSVSVSVVGEGNENGRMETPMSQYTRSAVLSVTREVASAASRGSDQDPSNQR
jgi:hypothetical protein